MGLRLHVETVPLWADIDTAIMEAGRQSLAGLTSAAIQGAPVIVEEFEMAVSRDDEEALDQLTFLFSDFMATQGFVKVGVTVRE